LEFNRKTIVTSYEAVAKLEILIAVLVKKLDHMGRDFVSLGKYFSAFL